VEANNTGGQGSWSAIAPNDDDDDDDDDDHKAYYLKAALPCSIIKQDIWLSQQIILKTWYKTCIIHAQNNPLPNAVFKHTVFTFAGNSASHCILLQANTHCNLYIMLEVSLETKITW
jgi:hypothetical protein